MTTKTGDALDLLVSEDLELRRLFHEIQNAQGSSVEDRAVYGDVAKELIRHVATREASLSEIYRMAGDTPALGHVAEQLEAEAPSRRSLFNQAEKMSRGVQGINLNTGQDFDGVLQELMQVVGTEIEWDLGEVIPTVRAWVHQTDSDDDLSSADHVTKHAPTSLHPVGPRWYERAPLVSRVITVYDHLRDFPRAVKKR
jgi:hypothetical protein